VIGFLLNWLFDVINEYYGAFFELWFEWEFFILFKLSFFYDNVAKYVPWFYTSVLIWMMDLI